MKTLFNNLDNYSFENFHIEFYKIINEDKFINPYGILQKLVINNNNYHYFSILLLKSFPYLIYELFNLKGGIKNIKEYIKRTFLLCSLFSIKFKLVYFNDLINNFNIDSFYFLIYFYKNNKFEDDINIELFIQKILIKIKNNYQLIIEFFCYLKEEDKFLFIKHFSVIIQDNNSMSYIILKQKLDLYFEENYQEHYPFYDDIDNIQDDINEISKSIFIEFVNISFKHVNFSSVFNKQNLHFLEEICSNNNDLRGSIIEGSYYTFSPHYELESGYSTDHSELK